MCDYSHIQSVNMHSISFYILVCICHLLLCCYELFSLCFFPNVPSLHVEFSLKTNLTVCSCQCTAATLLFTCHTSLLIMKHYMIHLHFKCNVQPHREAVVTQHKTIKGGECWWWTGSSHLQLKASPQ